MAMDALRNLVHNIPDWQRRLGDLNGQIERRQAELAAVCGTDPNSSASPRSLRNKGSSESLKPKDDGPMHPSFDIYMAQVSSAHKKKNTRSSRTPSNPTQEPIGEAQALTASPPSPRSENRVALHKQAQEAVAAHTQASATQMRKKRKSSSMVSAEAPPATHRTRSMIIVYYDSYVQGFFDDLVRFISSGRNLMRKAKMANKVAQIKRMAELEIANDARRSGDERFVVDAIPSLRYMSTRRLGPASNEQNLSMSNNQNTLADRPADIYDSLDKSLEFVQSTCEHGAHQFLRDADCYDEIKKIQSCLVEVLAAAKEEIDRVQREEPELAKETGELGKARMHRPISVRRDMTDDHKDEITAEPGKRLTLEVIPSKSAAPSPSDPLEVDANLAEDDLEDLLPTLQYRSTRLMRSNAV